MTIPMPPLPAGWQQSRLRFVAAINPSKTEISHVDPSTEVSFVPMEAVGEDASLDASRLKPVSEVSSGYTYFRNGDILIAKITPCFENGKATLARGLTGGFGFGSTEFHVVRPSPRLDARFAFYVIRSNAFREYGAASMYGAGGQKRVPTDFIADYPVALPTLSDQRAIADFLDRETAKIDVLIVKQEELIEKIEEKKQSTISSLMIGREVGGPRTIFESEWLPDIPSSWKSLRLKDVCLEIVDCKNRTPPALDGGEYFVARTTCVRGGVFNQSGGYFTDYGSFLEWTRKGLPRDGDIILSREAPMGEACLFPIGLKLCLGQRMMFARPNRNMVLPEFVLMALYAPLSREYIDRKKKGSTVGHLRVGEVHNFPLLLPSLSEQEQIVKVYRQLNDEMGKLVDRCGAALNILRERRSALITAAVTGQIEIAANIIAEAAA